MIAYAMVLLTDLEDVNTAATIEVQLGTFTYNLCGEMVRSFMRCANEAAEKYPGADVLTVGLEHVPTEIREVIGYLHGKLRGIIV